MNILHHIDKPLSDPLFKAIKANINAWLILLIVLEFILTKCGLITLKKSTLRPLQKKDRTGLSSDQFKRTFIYIKFFAFSIVFFFILNIVGVNLQSIFIASTVLWIGFAIQQFYINIISGRFILSDKSISIKDIIGVEGKIGHVTKMNLYNTPIPPPEMNIMIVPNSKWPSKNLFNCTQNQETTQFFISIHAVYKTHIELVKQLLISIAMKNKMILKSPKPFVFFSSFGKNDLMTLCLIYKYLLIYHFINRNH